MSTFEEVPADFAFTEDANLESIEMGMRAIESNIKFGMAILAVSLGRIKREKLYLEVAPDFKNYLKLERTDLSYQKALHLAITGENFWKFRPEIRANGLRLSENLSKVRLIDEEVLKTDPMFWQRFKSFSVRELKRYNQKRKNSLNVQVDSSNDSTVSATQSALFIDGEKVRGLDLKDVRQQTALGKRAVVLWVEDDYEARKIRKLVEENS